MRGGGFDEALRGPFDIRLADRTVPGKKNLLVDRKKKLGAIALRTGLLEICDEVGFAPAPALSLGDEHEREEDRKQRQAEGERGAIDLHVGNKLGDGLRLRPTCPNAGGEEEESRLPSSRGVKKRRSRLDPPIGSARVSLRGHPASVSEVVWGTPPRTPMPLTLASLGSGMISPTTGLTQSAENKRRSRSLRPNHPNVERVLKKRNRKSRGAGAFFTAAQNRPESR